MNGVGSDLWIGAPPSSTTASTSETSMITGYGRGWQEPRATGLLSRFFQKMREPATVDDLGWMIATALVGSVIGAMVLRWVLS